MSSITTTSQIPSDRLHHLLTYYTNLHTQISTEALAGNSNTLITTLSTGLRSCSARCVLSSIPIPELELELHSHWYTLVTAAKAFDHDGSKQDTLIRMLLAVQERGTLLRKGEDGMGKGTEVRTSGGGIWSDLPFLVGDIREVWKGAEKMDGKQRINFAAFLAKMTSVGMCSDAFAACAIPSFRDALKTPRKIHAADPGEGLSVEELLEVVDMWLMYAIDQIILLSSSNFGESEEYFKEVGVLAKEKGVSEGGFTAFSSSRWRFWRGRLEELSKEDGNVGELATGLVNLMKEGVEQTGTELTEVSDIWK